jgi:hypothetical protein
LSQTYTGRFSATNESEPIGLEGFIRIWVEGDGASGQQRELIADFSVGGNPNNRTQRKRGRPRSSNRAPALSSDGQAILYVDEQLFQPGESVAIYGATFLPQIPPWATPLGPGYRLLATSSRVESDVLSKASLSLGYSESAVPLGEEMGVRVYFWADGSAEWEPLMTMLDRERNEAVARVQLRPGVYILMSSLLLPLQNAGWNLVYSYPGATVPITDALRATGGGVTTVYSYAVDSQDNGRWRLYDTRVPSWTNELDDLFELRNGASYWLRATQPLTWLVTTVESETVQARQGSSLSAPPASYYGVLTPPEGATAAEFSLEARIGDKQCGVGQATDLPGGQIGFLVHVRANGPGNDTGCGQPGREVHFVVNGHNTILAQKTWDNSDIHELMPPEPIEVHLPLTLHSAAEPEER